MTFSVVMGTESFIRLLASQQLGTSTQNLLHLQSVVQQFFGVVLHFQHFLTSMIFVSPSFLMVLLPYGAEGGYQQQAQISLELA